MAQSKTTRLLDLIALLLARTVPVTKEEIRRGIPGYQGLSDESFDRVFERDKRELRGLGVPLKAYAIADRSEITDPRAAAGLGRDCGYLVDKREYFLPQLDLTADEWAAISLAGPAAARLRDPALAGALDSLLRKVMCQRPAGAAARPEIGLAPGQRADAAAESANLARLREAVQERVRCQFTYYTIRRDATATRQADPYVLVYNGGTWYLIGHCHLRGEDRVFKLSRISGLKLLRSAPRFTVPRGFDKRQFLGRKAWQFPAGPEQDVVLKVPPEHRWLVKHELQDSAAWDETKGIARISVRNPDPFVRWACANRDRARITAPPELARLVEQRAARTRARYAAPGRKQRHG
ncbi:MAG: WYL domain-containing protein [Candidatus Edwardsbacteria bacterium]|jgi:predicted DNA-binding transcriptional regulator YafY|nr:WYL domain-containing protein [Candidatus Edwardsbacteria bacterium]